MTSADIVRELQGARPVASDALRLRIRTLEPAPARAPGRLLARLRLPELPRRRGLLIALPAAALLAVAAAGITGALESGSSARAARGRPNREDSGALGRGRDHH